MADESRAVMLRPQTDMTLAQMKEFSEWAVKSGKFKAIKNPVQALMLLQYGRELGFGPCTALQCVYEVNGIPSLKANTIASRVKTVSWQGTAKNRYNYKPTEYTNDRVTLEFYERNDDGRMEVSGSITFTMEDAKRAGFTKNDTYRKHPRNMLFARCLTEGARVFCPDCLGGITPYTPDELGAAVDDDGTPVTSARSQVDWDAVAGTTSAVDVQDAEIVPSTPSFFDGIDEKDFVSLQAAANRKNVCLSDVVAGLGGDPNDLRGMSRGLFEQTLRFIAAK